ncbi:MAG: hypothetical protein ACXU8A_09940 [Burkholderiaceae bacterium]
MQTRSYYPLALLASVSLHILASLSAVHADRRDSNDGLNQVTTITVQLVQNGPQDVDVKTSMTSYKTDSQINTSVPDIATHANSSIEKQGTSSRIAMKERVISERSPVLVYLPPLELTRAARVREDIDTKFILKVPDISAQSATVLLLINEQGEIDKISLEGSQLPEKIQKLVINAFPRIKFFPGKIGNTAVKSQVKFEVTLKNENDPSSALPDHPSAEIK